MEIRVLNDFTPDDRKQLGTWGYKSDSKYFVTKKEDMDNAFFNIECRKIEKEFVKVWNDSDLDYDMYRRMISEGLSFGAYINNELAGVVICEKQEWNGTIMVWHIQVSENHRKMGIGRILLEKVEEEGKNKEFRIINLEVQNTNAGAVKFYKKAGYVIDGVDVSFYTNDDIENGDVALFMKKKLK